MATDNEMIMKAIESLRECPKSELADGFKPVMQIKAETIARIVAVYDRELAAKDAEIARLRRPTPVDDDLLKMARDIDAKDREIAELKGRLEAVVKMLEEEESRTSCDDCNIIFGDSKTEECECRFSEQHSIYEKMLRAAHGNELKEEK